MRVQRFALTPEDERCVVYRFWFRFDGKRVVSSICAAGLKSLFEFSADDELTLCVSGSRPRGNDWWAARCVPDISVIRISEYTLGVSIYGAMCMPLHTPAYKYLWRMCDNPFYFWLEVS